MLAAAPNVPSSQELFRLVLSLISSGSSEIPKSLKDHFLLVLRQAKIIADNASTPLEGVLPESIDLAFDIKKIKGLSDTLSTIDDVEKVSADLAHKLLISMEPPSVHQD